jgi:hypothetical protein
MTDKTPEQGSEPGTAQVDPFAKLRQMLRDGKIGPGSKKRRYTPDMSVEACRARMLAAQPEMRARLANLPPWPEGVPEVIGRLPLWKRIVNRLRA